MKFGWWPKLNISDPPIPLYFNYAAYTEKNVIDSIEIYSGIRPRDSYEFHRILANKADTYTFKFPNLIQHAIYDYPKSLSEVIDTLPDFQYDTSVRYEGMNEDVFDC